MNEEKLRKLLEEHEQRTTATLHAFASQINALSLTWNGLVQDLNNKRQALYAQLIQAQAPVASPPPQT